MARRVDGRYLLKLVSTSILQRIMQTRLTSHDTVEIAPADDETKRNATGIDAFEIVRCPSNGVRNTRIDSESTNEDTGILNVWRLC